MNGLQKTHLKTNKIKISFIFIFLISILSQFSFASSQYEQQYELRDSTISINSLVRQIESQSSWKISIDSTDTKRKRFRVDQRINIAKVIQYIKQYYFNHLNIHLEERIEGTHLHFIFSKTQPKAKIRSIVEPPKKEKNKELTKIKPTKKKNVVVNNKKKKINKTKETKNDKEMVLTITRPKVKFDLLDAQTLKMSKDNVTIAYFNFSKSFELSKKNKLIQYRKNKKSIKPLNLKKSSLKNLWHGILDNQKTWTQINDSEQSNKTLNNFPLDTFIYINELIKTSKLNLTKPIKIETIDSNHQSNEALKLKSIKLKELFSNQLKIQSMADAWKALFFHSTDKTKYNAQSEIELFNDIISHSKQWYAKKYSLDFNVEFNNGKAMFSIYKKETKQQSLKDKDLDEHIIE